jgi:hypothetical protein
MIFILKHMQNKILANLDEFFARPFFLSFLPDFRVGAEFLKNIRGYKTLFNLEEFFAGFFF